MHRQPPTSTHFARSLRANATDAEAALWRRLRSRQLGGAKFRRQVTLGPYVGDLVCLDARLVVECDGGQHAGSSHDEARNAWMAANGWLVLRFWNHEVLQNIEGVLQVIATALGGWQGGHSPSPRPSPWEGEGAKPAAPEATGIAPSPSQGEGRGEGECSNRHPNKPAPPQ